MNKEVIFTRLLASLVIVFTLITVSTACKSNSQNNNTNSNNVSSNSSSGFNGKFKAGSENFRPHS